MAEGDRKVRQLLTPKVPPHSEEAEMSVLGGMMLNSRSVLEVSAVISEADFYFEKHRTIYAALMALHGSDRPCDFVTVTDWLRNAGKLEEVDGMPYLGHLVNDTPGAANVVEYARIVRERSMLRALVTAGDHLAELAFRPDGRDAAEIVNEAQAMVTAIGRTANARDPVDLAQLTSTWMHELSQRAKRRTGGIQTGLKALDKATGGLEPGDLVVVAGRPAMGKTAFALCIADYITRKGGAALGFSMEMPKQQWLSRLVANIGGVPMGRIKQPWELDDIDYNNISLALSDIDGRKFTVDDTPGLTIKRLSGIARRVHHKTPLSVIVVDYIQLMEGEGKNRDEFRSQMIDAVTRGLKALAKELGCPIIALSQLNRKVEERDNKRPRMSDLRESGSIEQDADIVIGLYRDAVYNQETSFPDLAEAIILKQRNGETGTHDLTYQGEFFRFSDWRGPTRDQRMPRSAPKAKKGLAAMGPEIGPAPGDYDDTPSAANGWNRN